MSRASLCRQLGYEFARPALLGRALTHRSFGIEHYERLEFLGDSVLNCIIADHLYATFPQMPEGDLSRLRSNLVNQQTLCILAQKLELGSELLLGEGERKSNGHRRPSILADTLEAIFGAIFLDAGFEVVKGVVMRLYQPYLDQVDLATLGKDAKTLLQEFLQGKKLPLPQYSVLLIEGEAHAQSFRVECRIERLGLTTQGQGASRRAAEQQAAEAALLALAGK